MCFQSWALTRGQVASAALDRGEEEKCGQDSTFGCDVVAQPSQVSPALTDRRVPPLVSESCCVFS